MRFKLLMFLIFSLFSLSNMAQTISFIKVGEGQKPNMILKNEKPIISAVYEDAQSGYLSLFDLDSKHGVFNESIVYSGNYYGPGYVALSGGEPIIALHAHDINGGGAAVFYGETNWAFYDASDVGHDGWDISMVGGEEDTIYMSYIDAIPFGGPGLQYSVFDGLAWEVDTVGTTLLNYGYGTSLLMDGLNNPEIYFYNSTNKALELAYKNNGVWEIENIDSVGDVGYFCEAKTLHDTTYLAYVRKVSTYSGELIFAKNYNSKWEFEVLDTITQFSYSLMGRKPLDIEVTDSVYIFATSTHFAKQYSVSKSTHVFKKQTILKVDGQDSTLNQNVSLSIDSLNYFHYCLGVEVNNVEEVVYGTTSDVLNTNLPFNSGIDIYPNPFYNEVKLINKGHSGVVLDVAGKVVSVIDKSFGEQVLDLSFLSKGVYFFKVGTDTKVMIKNR